MIITFYISIKYLTFTSVMAFCDGVPRGLADVLSPSRSAAWLMLRFDGFSVLPCALAGDLAPAECVDGLSASKRTSTTTVQYLPETCRRTRKSPLILEVIRICIRISGNFWMNFCHCKIGAIQRILLITREVVDEVEFSWIFLVVWCLRSNKPFDFGADPDQDSDQGILKGIST